MGTGLFLGLQVVVVICTWIIAKAVRRLHKSLEMTSLILFKLKADIDELAKEAKGDRNRFLGRLAKTELKTRIAEKFAEKGMSLASGANIATIAIQRSLYSGRRMPTKEVLERDALARKKVQDILGGSEWEYLKPLLNEEELDVLEKAMEHKVKFNDAGN